MQDLAHWLEALGMSEYAQRFAENGIEFSGLPSDRIKTSRISASYLGTGASYLVSSVS